MCFCESDAINIMILLKTRQRYPGVKFHESTLARVAQEFGIRSSTEVKNMPGEKLARIAARVLEQLPPEACPPLPATRTEVA
ncbi:MAG: hypothetical protein OEY27_01065 [Gammaproteobacteria bacterium]|nr:hypothetical protein [Gammaproteobacteria bacterium]